MNAAQLLAAADSLNPFLAQFHPCFPRRENREWLAVFSRGQLGDLLRKSLEPIALEAGLQARPLQLFFDTHTWDELGVRARLQSIVAERFGSADGIFLVDETSDAKKGEHTAGVGHQYCGESGKIDNCIVSVHLGYTDGVDHALIDGELFLPEHWDAAAGAVARKRRLEVGIPADVGHVNKPQMSVLQLKRAKENGVPGMWVTGDEAYGGNGNWRGGVAELGLYYVAEVPGKLVGWTSADAGLTPTRSIADVAAGMRAGGERWRVHEGAKGPEIWKVQRRTFYTSSGEGDGAHAGTLLVAQHAKTKEVKYFLSNAPAGTRTGRLLRVAFSRWRIERCFQDAKTELGLNHAEMRNYRGIQRHLILTSVTYLFLVLLQRAGGGNNQGRDDQPTRGRRRGDPRREARAQAFPRETAGNRRKARAADQGDNQAQPHRGGLGEKATNPVPAWKEDQHSPVETRYL